MSARGGRSRRRNRNRAPGAPGLRPATRQALALIIAELSRLDGEMASLDLYSRAQALSAAMAETKFASLSATPPGQGDLAHGAALAILALALTVEGAVITEGRAEGGFDASGEVDALPDFDG